MAHDPNDKILPKDVDENNFEKYLKQEGFTDFHKLKSDYDKKHVTFDKIIELDKSELEEMLSVDYHVKVIQKIRFIRAIKQIPSWIATHSEQSSSYLLICV